MQLFISSGYICDLVFMIKVPSALASINAIIPVAIGALILVSAEVLNAG